MSSAVSALAVLRRQYDYSASGVSLPIPYKCRFSF